MLTPATAMRALSEVSCACDECACCLGAHRARSMGSTLGGRAVRGRHAADRHLPCMTAVCMPVLPASAHARPAFGNRCSPPSAACANGLWEAAASSSGRAGCMHRLEPWSRSGSYAALAATVAMQPISLLHERQPACPCTLGRGFSAPHPTAQGSESALHVDPSESAGPRAEGGRNHSS